MKGHNHLPASAASADSPVGVLPPDSSELVGRDVFSRVSARRSECAEIPRSSDGTGLSAEEQVSFRPEGPWAGTALILHASLTTHDGTSQQVKSIV